jgi:hypothetical protein
MDMKNGFSGRISSNDNIICQLNSSSVSNHELIYLSTPSLTVLPDHTKHSGKSID